MTPVAKAFATDIGSEVASLGVQIHGGMGVTWDAGLHLHVRRARTLAMEQGNTLFWEDLLVDQLEGQTA